MMITASVTKSWCKHICVNTDSRLPTRSPLLLLIEDLCRHVLEFEFKLSRVEQHLRAKQSVKGVIG